MLVLGRRREGSTLYNLISNIVSEEVGVNGRPLISAQVTFFDYSVCDRIYVEENDRARPAAEVRGGHVQYVDANGEVKLWPRMEGRGASQCCMSNFRKCLCYMSLSPSGMSLNYCAPLSCHLRIDKGSLGN